MPIEGWPFLAPQIYSVAVHPSIPDVMFAGSGVWEFHGGEIYKSVDRGLTWYRVTVQWVNARIFVFDPYAENVIYAGTSSGVILKSSDAGESWDFSHSGLPEGIHETASITIANWKRESPPARP